MRTTLPAALARPRVRERPAPFRVHDGAFAAVLGHAPRLERVIAVDAHEGPVYSRGEDALYFTTVPRGAAAPLVAIKRLALDGERLPLRPERLSVVRADANAANGMALDGAGRLVVCEQGSRTRDARIARLDPVFDEDETLVDRWGALRLNSPNDVVIAGDGAIWFTDPGYGHLQGFRPRPQAGDHVYRFDPASGRIAVVADDFDKPNGLAFSPDGGVLYVADSGANQEPGSFHAGRPHHIRAFDVRDGRHLTQSRLFAVTSPGIPDGLKVDSRGHVYASCSCGVQVFDPSGDLIGEIALPGAVNFCFGGVRRNVLFITTDAAIWAATLAARGA